MEGGGALPREPSPAKAHHRGGGGAEPAPKNAGGQEPQKEPVVCSPNTQESVSITAPQPTQQTPEDGSVLHEPVLDKNILNQFVGEQLKVQPTASNQESLAKASGILQQVQKLRQDLNQIQLGPREPAEEEEGKNSRKSPPPGMALKKMAEDGHITTRSAEGQRVMRNIDASKTEESTMTRKPTREGQSCASRWRNE